MALSYSFIITKLKGSLFHFLHSKQNKVCALNSSKRKFVIAEISTEEEVLEIAQMLCQNLWSQGTWVNSNIKYAQQKPDLNTSLSQRHNSHTGRLNPTSTDLLKHLVKKQKSLQLNRRQKHREKTRLCHDNGNMIFCTGQFTKKILLNVF